MNEVKIGKNVEYISQISSNVRGSSPFGDNPNLETITVDAANPYFTDMGGKVLYEVATDYLISGTKHGFIPDGTITIGAASFRDFEITEITIPNTVKYIHVYAFFNTKLTEINIPDSVERIDSYNFSGGTYTEVRLSRNVQFVGSQSFNSETLREVYVYNPDMTITNNAFNRLLVPPEDLIIYGYANSTAETYANNADGKSIPLYRFLK